MSRSIPIAEWWQEYAKWWLGERDGPLCRECAETIPEARLIPDCLCVACEEDQKRTNVPREAAE